MNQLVEKFLFYARPRDHQLSNDNRIYRKGNRCIYQIKTEAEKIEQNESSNDYPA